MAQKLKTSKAELALDTIGTEIVSGELPVGSTFTLAWICERFNISRTIAREVMRALEHRHLVVSSRRVGLRVLPRRDWWVLDRRVIQWRLNVEEERDVQLRSLTSLRLAIEPQAARGMALNGPAEQAAKLVEMAAEMRRMGEAGLGASPEFIATDVAYHVTILKNCGNEMFEALYPTVETVLVGRLELGLQPDYPSQTALKGHEDLAMAIITRDGAEAERLSQELLVEVRETFDLQF